MREGELRKSQHGSIVSKTESWSRLKCLVYLPLSSSVHITDFVIFIQKQPNDNIIILGYFLSQSDIMMIKKIYRINKNDISFLFLFYFVTI